MAKRRKPKKNRSIAVAEPVVERRAPLRALGLFSVLCIGVNAIVGSGIFRFPGEMGHLLGGASWIAFALVGVMLISVGLCFAEMGGMFDASGGPYVYAREAFGRAPAFIIGWLAWVTMVVSWAGVANAITGYASTLIDYGAVYGALVGAGLLPTGFGEVVPRVIVASLIVVPGVLNYFGVKPGAYALNTFTIAKLLPLIAFVAIGIWFVDWSAVAIIPDTARGVAPLGAAMFSALFAMQGFEVAPVPAGESKNPTRNIPIAVIGSLIGCAIFYVLIQIVAYGVEPAIATNGTENVWSSRPLADAAGTVVGPTGATVMAIGAVVSMTGFSVGSGLATPRFLAVLAGDGLFPKWLAGLHPRFASPHRAIAFTTVVALAASQLAGFDDLIDIANVTVTLQYVATCVAVIWLRQARPNAPRGYRIPFGAYPIPLFAIAVCALLLSQAQATQWFVALGVVLLGGFLALVHHTFSHR
jgi:amino acid transporter